MSTSEYRLPCVYCAEGTFFPSSEALKKHFLSSHENLSNGSRSYEAQEDRSAKRLQKGSVSSDVYRSFAKHLDSSCSPVGKGLATSYSTPPSSFSPMQSESEILVDMSEKKIKRLSGTILTKEQEIEKLLTENESLKLELKNKEEQQRRLRQKWRQEAENAIRNWKTNYEDISAQNRLLERQLTESEQDKIKLRNDSDKIVKDHVELQTKVAADKRNSQRNEQRDKQIVTAEKKLDSEKELRKILTSDIQTIRKENEHLATVVVSKDDTIKILQATNQKELIQEKNKNNNLNRKILSLKVQLAMLEANRIHFESDAKNEKGSVKNLKTKLIKMEQDQLELDRKMISYNDENEALSVEIKNLKDEKQKLVQNLQNADDALNRLSHRIVPPAASAKSTVLEKWPDHMLHMPSVVNDAIKISLEEILETVKLIPLKDHNSTRQELNRVTGELNRVNLLLVEEKAKVQQLKQSLTEMEEYLQEKEEEGHTETKRYYELQVLRSKHQKCIRKDKICKQLRKEQRILKRKYSDSQQQQQLLHILFESAKHELNHTEGVLKDLQRDRKQMEAEHKIVTKTIEKLHQDVSDRDITLEKYKRESCFLLEKINNTAEESEISKKKNESLEVKCDEYSEFGVMKGSLEQLQASLLELHSRNNQSLDDNGSIAVQALSQRNIDLTNQVVVLHRKLCAGDHGVEQLSNMIHELEIAKDNGAKEIERLQGELRKLGIENTSVRQTQDDKYDATIEHLILEKDILSSRVLVLEGIREEMEILRVKKEKLSDENKRIKRMLSERNESDEHDTEDGMVLINNQSATDDLLSDNFLEDIKKLDDLDEEDKIRLKQMLSTPEFERFLSSNEIVINLHETSNTSAESDESAINLSKEDFESEHVVNHIFEVGPDQTVLETCSEEFVQQIHEREAETLDNARTVSSLDVQDPNSARFVTIYPYAKTKPMKLPEDLNQKNLEKLFSDSKLISSDIAIQKKQTVHFDFTTVLKEFKKVITEMGGEKLNISAEERNQSSSKIKQVKFSDHVVEVFEDNDEDDSSDSELYRSFFQDALKKTYPVLARYEDEDIQKELTEESGKESSCSSDIDASTTSINGTSYSPSSSSKGTRSEQGSDQTGFTTKSLQLLKPKPSVDNELNLPYTDLLRQTLMPAAVDVQGNINTSSYHGSINGSKNLLNTLSEPIPTFVSTHFDSRNHSDNAVDRRIKRVGILSLITENSQSSHNTESNNSTMVMNYSNSAVKTGNNCSKNYGNDDVLITVQPAEDQLFNHTQSRDPKVDLNVTELLRGDDVSMEDFGRSLFSNDRSIDNRNNLFPRNDRLNVPVDSSLLASTPSVPSTIHKPVSLDFSDASFNDMSLFADTYHS